MRFQKNYALSIEQRDDARAALAMLPEGKTLVDAVASLLRDDGRAVARVTVREVGERFVASRRREKLRPSSVLWYENKLGCILATYGADAMDDVTREKLERLIESLPCGDSTRKSHYRAARALWRWAKAQAPALAGRDPTEGISVTAQKEDSDGAEFLSVPEVLRIMQQLPARHKSAAALLFFAGIRPEEIAGKDKPAMLWKQVDCAACTISVEASQAKTRTRRVLQELPPAVWPWLNHGRADEPIAASTSQQLIRAIQQAGGFWKFVDKGRGRKRKTAKAWPHDVTRHTFGTMHVNAFNDPGKAALLMGHGGNPRMLYTHYLGLATKADALAYWQILPPA